MSTNFPTSLDSYSDKVDNTDDVLASHVNDIQDAIEALETKLGINGSVTATTIEYFLKHSSGAYRNHIHDGTSDDGAKLDWDSCWSDAVHDHSTNAEGGVLTVDNVFKTGDWILSTVTTARTGWTNVSATYSNKFLRINATPLTTGGADTHSHTLAITNMPAHTHTFSVWGQGAAADTGKISAQSTINETTATTSSTGSGTAFTGDNVPAYVQVVIFQKD